VGSTPAICAVGGIEDIHLHLRHIADKLWIAVCCSHPYSIGHTSVCRVFVWPMGRHRSSVLDHLNGLQPNRKGSIAGGISLGALLMEWFVVHRGFALIVCGPGVDAWHALVFTSWWSHYVLFLDAIWSADK
jgi:hypothetical protein